MADDQHAIERPIDLPLARALKGEASREEAEAVRQWRGASPENEIEYRELARLVEWSVRTPGLIEIPARPSAAELIRRSGMAVPRRHSRWGRGGAAWLAAAAAAVVLVAAFGDQARRWLSGTPAFGIREIVTAKSETATLELLDGTVIRLAPSGRLRVLPSRDGRREVELEGRGFFAVAKRNGIPFVIRTQAGAVTVLGTRLDVEAHGQDLRLVVVEGRVALSTDRERTEVTAGEMGRITSGATAPVVKVPDVDSIVGWTGDFLAFQSTPLRDAAREIERVYGTRVEIQDDELAQRVITAWFWDRSLAEVVDVVCLAVAARCTIEDGVVRVRPAPQAARQQTGVFVHGGGR